MKRLIGLLIAALVPLAVATVPASATTAAPHRTVIVNTSPRGTQAIRRDTAGHRLDAHTGAIYDFGGTFYLYGTGENCGWTYLIVDGKPPCGIKVYRSTNLNQWTYVGLAFNVHTSFWRDLCASGTGGGVDGCWEPRVLYNAATNRYVMWLLTEGVYTVLTSKSPAGPFLRMNIGVVKSFGPHGDFDLFSMGGRGFIAFSSDVNRHIYVEPLTKNYLTGNGTRADTGARGEGTGVLVSGSRVNVVFGTLCGTCTGAQTSVVSSVGALGHFSAPKVLSSKTCGGQSRVITAIPTANGTAYLFQADRWQGPLHEQNANYYWGTVSLRPNGTIRPIACKAQFGLTL